MPIQIAVFRAQDLPAVRRLMDAYLLEFDAGADPALYWDEEYFAALLRGVADGRLTLLLAREGDAPVGFALLRMEQQWYRASSKTGVFEEFYVAPAQRGQGIGRALVAHGTTLLRAHGATAIRASVLRTNITGLLFWQRVGFSIEVYDLYLSPNSVRT